MGFIGIPAALAGWLASSLSSSPAASAAEAGELKEGLLELAGGQIDSLMLEITDGSSPSPSPASDGPITCGDLAIYPLSRRVVSGNREVSLTPKEFDILYFLARNRGQVFTKEQIYRAVWDGDYLMDDSNIMAFIRKLRKKIEPSPDAPEYILTIWGVGYKFADE